MFRSTITSLTAAVVLVLVAVPAMTGAAEVLQHKEASGSGLLLPLLNPERGRFLFASKGCVVCHAVNGIGGEDAPAFDASKMSPAMDPFDFMARMWRGAEPMIAMQKAELGSQITFTGQELANIVAFIHNRKEQLKFSKSDIPARILRILE